MESFPSSTVSVWIRQAVVSGQWCTFGLTAAVSGSSLEEATNQPKTHEFDIIHVGQCLLESCCVRCWWFAVLTSKYLGNLHTVKDLSSAARRSSAVLRADVWKKLAKPDKVVTRCDTSGTPLHKSLYASADECPAHIDFSRRILPSCSFSRSLSISVHNPRCSPTFLFSPSVDKWVIFLSILLKPTVALAPAFKCLAAPGSATSLNPTECVLRHFDLPLWQVETGCLFVYDPLRHRTEMTTLRLNQYTDEIRGGVPER